MGVGRAVPAAAATPALLRQVHVQHPARRPARRPHLQLGEQHQQVAAALLEVHVQQGLGRQLAWVGAGRQDGRRRGGTLGKGLGGVAVGQLVQVLPGGGQWVESRGSGAREVGARQPAHTAAGWAGEEERVCGCRQGEIPDKHREARRVAGSACAACWREAQPHLQVPAEHTGGAGGGLVVHVWGQVVQAQPRHFAQAKAHDQRRAAALQIVRSNEVAARGCT